MWLIPTKKEVKKEFEKIKEDFKDNTDYHARIMKDYEACMSMLKELKEDVEKDALKIATLEGAYYVLANKSQVSVSPKSQGSLKQSQSNIETKLIQRIRNNKKSLVMAEIMKLTPSYSVIEMFEKIVRQQGLCSKASFYRYIESLKSQKLSETETKVRLK